MSGLLTNFILVAYPDSKHKRRSVRRNDKKGPDAPAHYRVLVQMATVAKEPHEEELASGVAVERAGNEEVRYCDPESSFHPYRREATEGRGGYAVAQIDVYDDGEYDVESCGKGLEGVSGFHGVLWTLHFRYQDEKLRVVLSAKMGFQGMGFCYHEVACICEDWVGNRREGVIKARR